MPSDPDDDATLPRLLRRTDVALALLAAIATVGFAWCGYQASAWTRERFEQSDAVSDLTREALSVESEADRLEEGDKQLFAQWVAALGAGQEEVADALAELFRPEVRLLVDEEAFKAGAPDDLDPFDDPEYSARELRSQARDLEQQAAEARRSAADASSAAARYNGIAVTFTAVLAATGIAIRFQNRRLRRWFVIVASFLTVGALALTVISPVEFG